MAIAATRWLPKLEKQPDRLTLSQMESGLTDSERHVVGGLILIMQGTLIILTASILHTVSITTTMPWDYGDALVLAAFNLFPALLLGLILFGMRYNYTLCPQGHLAHRSQHSRYCDQCGLPLLTRQPL